jgi:hypothetical protein
VVTVGDDPQKTLKTALAKVPGTTDVDTNFAVVDEPVGAAPEPVTD